MKKHIFLIEPDIVQLPIFLQAIAKVGAPTKCTYARDVTHALQMLDHLKPDALFFNLDPKLEDNLEQVRKIKFNHRLGAIPIAVYCNQMQYFEKISLAYGANHCLTYPFDDNKICSVLCKMLHVQPAGPHMAQSESVGQRRGGGDDKR